MKGVNDYMEADIHSFESLAALDGDGIRYDVFFTGCPLRCACCHNPDTWYPSGRKMTSEELFKKIQRYKPYFKNGGGVTFSGGEPLLNARFINEVNGYLKNVGINYVVDTSGSVELSDDVKTAVDNAELVILDVKFPNADMYERYVKGDFDKFCRFADYLSEAEKRVWYRTVIIPRINDTEEMLDEYLKLASRWRKPEKYELLAFHTMGFYKYEQMGINNPLKNTEAMEKDKLHKLQEYMDKKRFG